MKRIARIFPALLLLAVSAPPAAHAKAPRKPPLMGYSRLWNPSPFTTKPVVEKGPVMEEVNPFEDWALGGVGQTQGHYIVVLFNRKDAKKKVFVEQGDPKAEFRIVAVKEDPNDRKNTVVTLTSGGKTGTVTFDEKLLAQRGAVAAKARQVAAARARSQKKRPPIPGVRPSSGAPRPPRMRVIPQSNKKTSKPPSRGGHGRHR